MSTAVEKSRAKKEAQARGEEVEVREEGEEVKEEGMVGGVEKM